MLADLGGEDEARIKAKMAADARSMRAEQDDFRFTTGQGAVYAIALGWPADGKWLVKSLGSTALPNVAKVSMPGVGDLAFTQTPAGLQVTAPPTQPYPHAWPLKVEVAV